MVGDKILKMMSELGRERGTSCCMDVEKIFKMLSGLGGGRVSSSRMDGEERWKGPILGCLIVCSGSAQPPKVSE